MMFLTALTLVHVLLSLVGIGAGLVVLRGMLSRKTLDGWTSIFLWTTLLTNVTGFLFPFRVFLPSHGVGIVSLILLAVAFPARYSKRMAGGWRRAYAGTAIAALYFNVFVLIAQLFQKVPALRALAPTQSEPAFAITQGVTLIAFVALGIVATSRFAGSSGMVQARLAASTGK